MSLRDRAKEALERAGAATVGRAEDGVWEIEREELDAEDFTKSEQALAFPQSVGPIASWEPGNLYDSRQHEADAVFIANARADVPDFAGAVLRLTGEEMRERVWGALSESFGGLPVGDATHAIMALLLAEVA